MRVVLRTDASASIGIGHAMRCLALAQALRDAGDAVTLVTTPGTPALERWRGEGVSVQLFDAEIGSASDAAATRAAVDGTEATWLVLDGYAFGADYQAAVRDAARLLVVDDHAAIPIEAELITNANFYATEAMYVASSASLLVGPRFALLRREFRRPGRPGVVGEGVILSLGGADPERRTAPVLRALAGRGLGGRVIVGPRQLGAPAVRAVASVLGWDVVEAPYEMASLLRRCELAVVGAGTTTLEVAAVGTAMVAVRIAENQQLVGAALERLGLAAVADSDDPDAVANAAVDLLADHARRSGMAARGARLVDGRGALRVAAAMRGQAIVLRPASMVDAELLLAWRNDAAARTASFSTAEVPRADHLAWLSRGLGDSRLILRIGELDGAPVGVVRLDREGASEATISVIVAREARGLGLATALIEHALAVAVTVGVARVVARIRPENAASRRAFAAAGFVAEPDSDASAVRMSMSLGVQG